jgi:hypothetical protein
MQLVSRPPEKATTAILLISLLCWNA